MIKLPDELRGYCRYVVVRHPVDALSYTIGVKYVKTTEGAVELCANLAKNVGRKHKKHVHSWLCSSVVLGQECQLADRCPNVHVTENGYENRRPWLRIPKGEKAEKGETSPSPAPTETSSPSATEEDTNSCTGSPTAAMLAGRRKSPPLPPLRENGETPFLLLQEDQSLCSWLPLCIGATKHTPYSLPFAESAPIKKILPAHVEMIAQAEHRLRLRRSSLRLMRRAVFPVGCLPRSGLESSWADEVECQMDFSAGLNFRHP